MMWPSLVEDFAGALGEAHLAAVLEEFVADPRRLVRFRIEMGDIRDMDRRLLLDDAARLAGGGTRMALDHVHALDEHAVLVAQHAQHLAAPALVTAGDDD